MNKQRQTEPWLFCEGTDENQPMVGNRAGFIALRTLIDTLLNGEDETTKVLDENLGFSELKLQEQPDTIEATPIRDQLLILSFAALIASIPILAIYGLFQLINDFF